MADILDAVKNRLMGIVPVEVLTPALNDVRREWAGETVYILQTDRAARDAAVLKLLSKGCSMRQAAMAAGVAPSTVRRIAACSYAADSR